MHNTDFGRVPFSLYVVYIFVIQVRCDVEFPVIVHMEAFGQ